MCSSDLDLREVGPALVDHYLDGALELDVDALCDGTQAWVAAILEHVEPAGVHSGDSACVLPGPSVTEALEVEVREIANRIVAGLGARGLVNLQLALHDGRVYVLEANPRASRTVPFVAKATGVPLVKVASRVMLGATLAELRTSGLLQPPVNNGHVAVKEAVLPFNRFPEVDTALGPEMRSTGQVMGIDSSFGRAFVKAESAAGNEIPTTGTAFLSLNDRDKPMGLAVAKRLRELGMGIAATRGTAEYLKKFGQDVDRVVGKVSEGAASTDDDAVELIRRGEIALVINTPRGRGSHRDGEAIRKAANICRVSSVTTINAALAAVQGLVEQRQRALNRKSTRLNSSH